MAEAAGGILQADIAPERRPKAGPGQSHGPALPDRLRFAQSHLRGVEEDGHRDGSCRKAVLRPDGHAHETGRHCGRGRDIETLFCVLCGASGSGKSFLASEFGRLSNLPFAAADMSSVTASAYVGTSVDELYLNFLNKGTKLADIGRGVLFLDEIDKKRTNNRNGDFDATGLGVQYELLRMLEGARIQDLKRGNDSLPRGAIDTTTMAFVLAGAVSDISDRLRDSAKARTPLGFSGGLGASGVPPDTRELLLGYFIPELVNRIGSVIVIPPPSLDQLIQIATAPTGIIARINQYLVAFGIRISPSPEAVKELASWALETRTYARGMRSLMQSLVEEAIFEERKGEVAIGIQEVRKAIEGLRQEPECLKT